VFSSIFFLFLFCLFLFFFFASVMVRAFNISFFLMKNYKETKFPPLHSFSSHFLNATTDVKTSLWLLLLCKYAFILHIYTSLNFFY
jgi:hypothetical protein